jgi:hypothetical protein
MTLPTPEDRFLAYYIALEAVSNDIRQSTDKTHKCRHCKGDTGIARSQMDGVKDLIKRHLELPPDTFAVLTRTRSKIVHGAGDEARAAAQKLEPLAQALAREGVALALGLDPSTVSLQQSALPTFNVTAQADFLIANHPAVKWGQSMRQALATWTQAVSRLRVQP